MKTENKLVNIDES